MLKGTIRKRGKKFQVIYPYKDEEGNHKQQSGTVGSMSDANALLKKFNYEIGDNMNPQNPRLSEVVSQWLTEVSLHGSRNTQKAYEYNSQFIIERLGDMKIKDIERKDIVKLYQKIKDEGYETKAYKTAFNMIMNFAISSKYISVNPGKNIAITRTNEKRKAKMLTMAERIQLITDLEGTKQYYLTYLLLKTGLRIGEALGLTWSRIDFEDKSMTINQQVTIEGEVTNKLKSKNSYRTVYLDDETMELLQELRRTPFTTQDFIFVECETIRSAYANLLRKYDLIPHDLRHNHGTDLLDICNIADAATRMGHTIEEYVSTYIHASDENQRMIAEKLNQAQFSFHDRIMTEQVSKVVNLSDINASRKQKN